MIKIDKVYHFFAGSYISTWVFIIMCKFLTTHIIWISLSGVVFSSIGGYLKEVYDKADYGVFDPIDVLATVAGGLVTSAILFLIFFP